MTDLLFDAERTHEVETIFLFYKCLLNLTNVLQSYYYV